MINFDDVTKKKTEKSSVHTNHELLTTHTER